MTANRPRRTGLLLAAALAGAAPVPARAHDPLARYLWKSRVLLILASDAADARLSAQRTALAPRGAGLAERDLAVVERIGDDHDACDLRRRFDVPALGFRALLIGKDGGVKLSSTDAIAPDALFAKIDAMPMRQREMRGR